MGGTRRRAPAGRKELPGGTGSELATTLTTVTFFQGAVQHADEKVRTVVAVQTMITALVAAQAGLLGNGRAGSAPRAILVGALICFALGYAYASLHVFLAIRPRTTPPSGTNRFAFPSVAAGTAVTGHGGHREQAEQAGELGRLLAALAMRKHHHVRSAMAGTCVLFASALVLVITSALP
jgi:predicted histidine transporter YuiF (NhaC family)